MPVVVSSASQVDEANALIIVIIVETLISLLSKAFIDRMAAG
jgi:hypothetical protein